MNPIQLILLIKEIIGLVGATKKAFEKEKKKEEKGDPGS